MTGLEFALFVIAFLALLCGYKVVDLVVIHYYGPES